MDYILFASLCVRFAQDPDFGLAFRGRQLAHRGGEYLVLDYGADALCFQHVLRVVHRNPIERAEDALQRSSRASALAAQMKSFSDSPPIACVAYSTRHWL